MILRRRQARRASDEKTQAVVERAQKRVAFAERFEIFFAERTGFAKSNERGGSRAFALSVRQLVAQLQVAHGEVNVEHPARPVLYVRAARARTTPALALQPFAHASSLGAQVFVARDRKSVV